MLDLEYVTFVSSFAVILNTLLLLTVLWRSKSWSRQDEILFRLKALETVVEEVLKRTAILEQPEKSRRADRD